jgi:hypothetical protein
MSMAANAYESADNSWNRVNGTSAGLYQISYTGQHSWYYTGASTAGSPITFTQAMTLDASGNLMLGGTSSTGYWPANLTQSAARQIIQYNDSTTSLNNANAGLVIFNSNTTAGTSSKLVFGAYNVDPNAVGLAYISAVNSTRSSSYLTGDLVFGTSGGGGTGAVERMRIFSDGNVGIATGATNAGYKLDVNGTGRFSATSTDYALTLQNIQDDSQGLLVRATDNDGSLFLLKLQSSNSSTGQTWVDRFTVAKNGAATFSSSITAADLITSNSGFRTNALNGYVLRDNANSVNLGGLTRRSFWAGGTALDTQIFAETGYSIFINPGGSSSIGLTLASTGAATFSSSVTAQGYFALTTTSNAYATQGTLSWNDLRGTVLSGKTASVYDVAIYGAAGQSLITNPTGTNVISFPSGNVGIGTSSPTYKFETLGTSVITAAFGRSDYGASNVMLIAMNGYRDVYKQAIGVVRTGDYDKGDMIFCLNGSANSTVVSASDERMRITSGGSVNINNTTNTTYKLSTYNNVEDTHVLIAGLAPSVRFKDTVTSHTYSSLFGMATVANNFITGSAAGDFAITWESTKKCFFGYTNTTPIMVLDGGNLGLGTLTIGSKAQINGNLAVGYSSSTAAPTDGILSNGGFKSSNPTGDTAQTWKLGSAYSGTVTHTHYVNVEVNGVIYSLLASNAV